MAKTLDRFWERDDGSAFDRIAAGTLGSMSHAEMLKVLTSAVLRIGAFVTLDNVPDGHPMADEARRLISETNPRSPFTYTGGTPSISGGMLIPKSVTAALMKALSPMPKHHEHPGVVKVSRVSASSRISVNPDDGTPKGFTFNPGDTYTCAFQSSTGIPNDWFDVPSSWVCMETTCEDYSRGAVGWVVTRAKFKKLSPVGLSTGTLKSSVPPDVDEISFDVYPTPEAAWAAGEAKKKAANADDGLAVLRRAGEEARRTGIES